MRSSLLASVPRFLGPLLGALIALASLRSQSQAAPLTDPAQPMVSAACATSPAPPLAGPV